jgi:benzil reductase ((S)-benzoin forming)
LSEGKTSRYGTIVWVTGGSSGLGEALVRTVPFPDCRVINVSRRPLEGVANLNADLSDPASWDLLRDHLATEFAAFAGGRAVFVHNAAATSLGAGFAGHTDFAAHRAQVLLNAAAPLVIGEAFLAACPARVDGGLVLLGSASASRVVLGGASYAAAKAGVEHWVRVVREERRRAGHGPWVVGVRPGTVDTPGMRAAMLGAAMPPERKEQFQRHLAEGRFLEPGVVARRIWALLPPDDAGPDVVLAGESISPQVQD